MTAFIATVRVSTPNGSWKLESVELLAERRSDAWEDAWTKVATRPGVWMAEVQGVEAA